jgi:ribonucleoside-diphosphate reductase alpha chain
LANKVVVVYGKPRCPYCVKAKKILDDKGIDYTYLDVSVFPEHKQFLEDNNHKTVPQIYVDGQYWGESDSAASIHKDIYVKKSDGSLELLDLDKIHKVLAWGSEGLEVSISQVELAAHLQLEDGVTSTNIHQTLIKSAADLISVDYPDYQYLAARLSIFHLRKKVYGQFTPPTLLDQVISVTKDGMYDKHILEDYSLEDFKELEKTLDHSRDLKFAYAGIKQIEGKYLVQNRVNGKVYETPQFLYMLVGMCLFSKYDQDIRLDYVKRFYEATSTFKLSLPTPIMGGVRTPTRQFSSCTLIEAGDDLNSINAASAAIVKYISQRAGIGINGGAIRALGSSINNGAAVHTGVIPFWKHFQTAVKSCSQGSIRGGSATLFYPFWHLEVENLLVLKNNKGVEDNRIRHLDYGVQFNKLMYQRLIEGGNITLFSPNAVEGMYEAFFADQEEFERLYTEAEGDPLIQQKSVSAVELFSSFAQERAGTGRIYLQNVDHCNTNSPFDAKVAPIKQSNLCCEICLPTKPLNNVNDEEGEVALCTLSALNLGEISSDAELAEVTELGVRALDELLDYQNYPLPAAELSSMNRRTLGLGIINYSYWLAKQGMKYSDGSANNATHELFEKIQYYSLVASNKLAQEKGACPYFHETTYSQDIMPMDRCKASVDELHSAELLMDWGELRSNIKTYGLRNSTLTALMPSETSSQVSNATNGIETPRGLVSVKSSKDGVLKQVVPDLKKLRKHYELLWDIPDNTGYLQLTGIMQKWVDQAISANTNYDPSKFEEGKVPMQVILQDLLKAYSYGVKTLYYHNTRDGSSESTNEEVIEVEDESCSGGACKI